MRNRHFALSAVWGGPGQRLVFEKLEPPHASSPCPDVLTALSASAFRYCLLSSCTSCAPPVPARAFGPSVRAFVWGLRGCRPLSLFRSDAAAFRLSLCFHPLPAPTLDEMDAVSELRKAFSKLGRTRTEDCRARGLPGWSVEVSDLRAWQRVSGRLTMTYAASWSHDDLVKVLDELDRYTTFIAQSKPQTVPTALSLPVQRPGKC